MPEPRRNERGYRVGEGHHRARFTDAQVHELRAMREAGQSYADIIAAFAARGVPITYDVVRKLCTYARRVQAGEMHP